MRLDFFINVLSTLLVVIDPLAVLPIYVSLTKDYSQLGKKTVRNRAIWISLGVLAVFTVFSDRILHFLQITIPAVQIGGGLLLIFFSFRELFFSQKQIPAQVEKSFDLQEPHIEDDIGAFPLGIPLLAGPGALSTIAVYRSETESYWDVAAILLSVVLVISLAWVILRYADTLMKFLSENTLHLITKLANLLLAVMATEILLSGIKNYLQNL